MESVQRDPSVLYRSEYLNMTECENLTKSASSCKLLLVRMTDSRWGKFSSSPSPIRLKRSKNLVFNFGLLNNFDFKKRIQKLNALKRRLLTWGPWRGSRGSTKITKVKFYTLLNLFYRYSGVHQ